MALTVGDYIVAWICALPLEMAAAKAMLDETHSPLRHQPPTDHNTYTLGRRGHHNIAIACLPSGVYGTISAATFGLMVGIGGGVPRENVDIRLGDVVVSIPSMTSGGVVQFDYGKTLSDGSFQLTGSLNKPPQFLLTTLSQVRSNRMIGDRHVTAVISRTLEKYPEMKTQFSRPKSDWLFRPGYEYQSSKTDCSLACDPGQLVDREPRPTDEPHIHYGLIASGNQMDILCLEMEAAGLVDQLPCLVIRGISDYCDSHKHKQWQGYAALSAAVYASELLETVPKHMDADPKERHGATNHWMVPFGKNLKFVGREEELARIEDIVNGPPTKVAIYGLGGVGKTQIALELAYRIREKHSSSVFWVPCTSHEAVDQAFSNIAQILRLHRRRNRWLFIFDNADSMDMWAQGSSAERSLSLTDYLPLKGSGHILFTARNRKVAVHLASSNVVHISVPNSEGAVQILEKSLIEKDLLDDFITTMTLLKRVAFLALAIIQAAAYINKNLIGLSDYIEVLQEQEADVIELLSEDFGDEARYRDLQNPVATTWLISFQQIQKLDQLAADYLSFMACIHPREIPLSLLPEASSKVKRTNALGLLKAFSFISKQAEYLNLYRLVHLSTRNWLRSQQQFGRQVSMTAMRFAARDFDWEQHTELIKGVGLCLGMDERYNEAIFFFKKLLRTQKQTHGDTNDKTLSCMADLAWAYRGLGRWIEAEELEIRVLETRKQILGPEHYKTLFAIRNLAFTWSRLGKWQDAEAMREQVLEIKKREIGPEHPATLDSMSDLARSYSKLGKGKEVELLQNQVFVARKRWIMVNLASTYRKHSKFKEAEELEKYVLETNTRVLGPDHPHTIRNMSNLASEFLGQNHHPHTLQSMQILSKVLRAQGRVDEALPLVATYFEVRNRLFGPDHPSTKSAAHSLEKVKKEKNVIRTTSST
ncbi:violaceus kinesin [Aspergillus keveii]|uniref:Violaceus kinesin n=1 Tax=Aspergillus keveii TaxID=714993 RepID=A0ABR4GIV0_9EURO